MPGRIRSIARCCVSALSLLTALSCHRARPWSQATNVPSIQQPKGDFTLIWDDHKLDANGYPLDPYWALEKSGGELPPREGPPPGSPPCLTDPFSPACADNPGIVLDPPQFPMAVLCRLAKRQGFDGHADWVLASQQGCIDWEAQAPDGDYNFRLYPPDPRMSGLTKNNELSETHDRFIGLEFDYDETIAQSKLKFWTDLQAEVDKENNDQRSHRDKIMALLNPDHPDVNPRAMALGLFGTDCEHNCKSEVHPVLAFAIETKATPDDDTWVLFIRNRGSGGSCGSLNHMVTFPSNRLSILLLNDPDSEGPHWVLERGEPKMTMYDILRSGIPAPTLSYLPGRGPVLTFTVPPGDKTPVYAELEIHLHWDKFKLPACKAVPPLAENLVTAPAAPTTAEGYLQRIEADLAKTRPALKKQFLAKAGTGQTGISAAAAVQAKPVPVPENAAVESFTPPTTTGAVRAPALQLDKAKLARDATRIKLLCGEYQNHLPPFNGKDVSQELCDSKKLDKTIRAGGSRK